ncbi:MAG TPA: ABC transporter permease [Bryobacteraceae bacterium]|nr:ABC transporter permease [Bryobacteraceae bacterium]
MRSLYEDLRYAIRVLRSSPGFTVVAVLTLALGIAANATVFGWIDALLMRPFPGVTAGGQLVALETVTPAGEYLNTSYRDYRDYRDGTKSFSGVAASLMNAFNVGPVDSPRRIFGEYVSGNYFAVLGVKPVRGRAFLPSEAGDKPGAFPVAVISYGLWQSLFHGDPGIVGRTVPVNRYHLTVAGIAPRDFRGTMPGMQMEIWISMTMAPLLNGQGNWLLDDRDERQMWVTARLAPGVPLAQANAEVGACARHLAELSPRTNTGFSERVMPVWRAHLGVQSVLLAPLRILMAVCFMLLLIVGANVANLQLARATARRRELSVRMALGAGYWRLVRQFLAESLMLAGMGALAAIPMAGWLGRSLLWLLPPVGFPVQLDFDLNAHTLAFTALLCCASALLTGMAPAIHTVKGNLIDALKEGGRSGTSTGAQHRTRGLLVASEVALALVALVGTVLFARSFQNARAIAPGLDANNVLFAKYHLDTFCTDREQRARFCLRLRDRIRDLPGIVDVSFTNTVPLEIGTGQSSAIDVEGYVPGRGEHMTLSSATVAPRYFDTLRIPLLQGRDFTEMDDRGTAPVVVVNQTFAQRYFGGGNPVGRRVRVDGAWSRVIGEVKDSKYHRLTEPPAPYLYLPYRQRHGDEFWTAFFVRTSGPARAAIPAIRREAAGIEPNAGTAEVVAYTETIAGSLYPQEVAASLLGVLGGVSVLLAALGLYSVLAYAVGQREHEFGIRLALGAQASDVVRLVLRQGMALTLAGVAVGAALAIAVMRLAAGLLVGVSPGDPAAIAVSALFLAAIALLASYLPARRATTVDPMVTLREP